MAAIQGQAGFLARLFLLEFLFQQKGVTQVILLEALEIEPLLALAHLGQDDARAPVFTIDGFEDAGVAVTQHQDAGQQQARQLVEIASDQATGETCTRGHA